MIKPLLLKNMLKIQETWNGCNALEDKCRKPNRHYHFGVVVLANQNIDIYFRHLTKR